MELHEAVMMYILHPKNESVVTWILKYGHETQDVPHTHKRGDDVVINLVKMRTGPVLRVCHSALELLYARNDCTQHGLTCRWYYVPISIVQPLMKGQRIS